MKLFCGFLLIALLLGPLPTKGAEPNSFNLVTMAGQKVGKASFTIVESQIGFRVRSSYAYHLMPEDLPSTKTTQPSVSAKGTPGQEAQIHAEYKVTRRGDLIDGYIDNQANGLLTSYSVDRQHRLEISSVQSGTHGLVNTVDMPKADYILAPLYDPAVVQMIVLALREQSAPVQSFILAVPSRGSVSPVVLRVEQAPEDPKNAGTLQGQPCPLRHLVFVFGEHSQGQPMSRADVFTDEHGEVMEADLDVFGIRYIRSTFILASR